MRDASASTPKAFSKRSGLLLAKKATEEWFQKLLLTAAIIVSLETFLPYKRPSFSISYQEARRWKGKMGHKALSSLSLTTQCAVLFSKRPRLPYDEENRREVFDATVLLSKSNNSIYVLCSKRVIYIGMMSVSAHYSKQQFTRSNNLPHRVHTKHPLHLPNYPSFLTTPVFVRTSNSTHLLLPSLRPRPSLPSIAPGFMTVHPKYLTTNAGASLSARTKEVGSG
jgi:hypothetical protein